MINKYGLIGYPLSHSFSPSFFKKKFEKEGISAEYLAYPIDRVSDFKELIQQGLKGLNVTIPYKEQVIPYMDELDESAASISAVNTIKVEEGRLIGYNTDVYGFQESLTRLELPFTFENSKSLILGAGGAAKAISYVLDKLGSQVTVVSRTRRPGVDKLFEEPGSGELCDYSIVVNTTPLGMAPNTEASPPINYEEFSETMLAYDLIYNPAKTQFLARAEKQGAKIMNGMDMLILQAEKSWEIWNNEE